MVGDICALIIVLVLCALWAVARWQQQWHLRQTFPVFRHWPSASSNHAPPTIVRPAAITSPCVSLHLHRLHRFNRGVNASTGVGHPSVSRPTGLPVPTPRVTSTTATLSGNVCYPCT
jgi:hypothetical protein